jgi:hypothetical protein
VDEFCRQKGTKMDHHPANQEWQRLQVHFDQIFGRYLRDVLNLIEYKPGKAVYLLKMSSEYEKEHSEVLR